MPVGREKVKMQKRKNRQLIRLAVPEKGRRNCSLEYSWKGPAADWERASSSVLKWRRAWCRSRKGLVLGGIWRSSCLMVSRFSVEWLSHLLKMRGEMKGEVWENGEWVMLSVDNRENWTGKHTRVGGQHWGAGRFPACSAHSVWAWGMPVRGVFFWDPGLTVLRTPLCTFYW